MNLGTAPREYDQTSLNQMLREIESADRQNFKANMEVQPRRLVLQDTVTGTRYQITVASGALTLTAL